MRAGLRPSLAEDKFTNAKKIEAELKEVSHI